MPIGKKFGAMQRNGIGPLLISHLYNYFVRSRLQFCKVVWQSPNDSLYSKSSSFRKKDRSRSKSAIPF